MLSFKSNPPLSLYIHLPWCIKKCPYCDFNSHATNQEVFPEDTYVDALISDLESELPRIWGRPIVSIFIGGGTPSLFSAEAIERLMAALRSRLTFYHNTEVTMEANPEQQRRNGSRPIANQGSIDCRLVYRALMMRN